MELVEDGMDFRAAVLKNPGHERGGRVPLLLGCQEGGTLVGRQESQCGIHNHMCRAGGK